MKCEKCGNDYPSYYYFATERICKECFAKMPLDEQAQQNVLMYDNMQSEEYAWRAGFGVRLGAALLDYLFFGIIFVIVLFTSGLIQEYQYVFEDFLTKPYLLEDFTNAIMPYFFIVFFMYYSLEIVLAASLGKIVLRLKIAGEDRKEAGYEKLVLRFIYKHSDTILQLIAFLGAMKFLDTLSSILGLVIIVGFFFVLSPKRQAFHDTLAKTAVFRHSDVISV
ncbi:MAG: RDD family protein [bacterium]